MEARKLAITTLNGLKVKKENLSFQFREINMSLI